MKLKERGERREERGEKEKKREGDRREKKINYWVYEQRKREKGRVQIDVMSEYLKNELLLLGALATHINWDIVYMCTYECLFSAYHIKSLLCCFI